MTRDEKANIIEKLADKFSAANTFYITDASGLTVAQVNAFRRLCYERGIEYGVYKNTLIRKALEKQNADFSEIFSALHGFSGVIFAGEVGNLPAKVIKEYRKRQNGEKPVLKAASVDTALFLGEENLEALSQLKSKNELIGDIIALLQSPAKNVISALLSGEQKVAGLVKALEEKKSKESN
ncbi:MAG TPA: 50S ribosomal protein L10 [Cyclobacteriaceae bacterium]|nr:50S ribosomal protein L10 [Cyclobacteriaceae bacterium]